MFLIFASLASVMTVIGRIRVVARRWVWRVIFPMLTALFFLLAFLFLHSWVQWWCLWQKVNVGAFAFPSWKEIELGSAVICRQFAKFGLEIHVGSATKASKTEAVFFPAPGFFKLLPLPPSKASSFSLSLTANRKQESEKSRRSREDKCWRDPIAEEAGLVGVRYQSHHEGNTWWSFPSTWSVDKKWWCRRPVRRWVASLVYCHNTCPHVSVCSSRYHVSAL